MHFTTTLRLSAAVAACSIALPVAAAPADEVARLVVRGDLYLAGGLVDVTERVEGDLIAAGGTVNIDNGIAGDLLVTGGQVDIKGPVRDDLRIAGGTVRIRGTVGGDLVVFGGDIVVDNDAKITGDVVLMGGTVRMEGQSLGNLRIDAEESVVMGEVKGNIVLNGGSVQLRARVLGNGTIAAATLTTSPQGRIEGKLDYWLSDGPRNLGPVVGGGATYRPELQPSYYAMQEPAAAAAGLGLLGFSMWSLFSAALFILIAQLFTRTYFTAAGKLLRKKPWRSLWNGFLIVTLMPIVGVLLLFTIIGIPLGFFVFAMWFFLLLFLKPIASLVLVRTLEQYWGRTWGFWPAFGMAVLIYAVLKLLMLVPVAGWLIVALICLAALGADNMTKWERLKKVR